jgi:hypothetical protein
MNLILYYRFSSGTLDQFVRANTLDLQEAILKLAPIHVSTMFSFAVLAAGLPLVAMHVQHAKGRRRIARRLVVAEEKLVEFQKCNV